MAAQMLECSSSCREAVGFLVVTQAFTEGVG